jgi:hypothetical protein
MTVFVAGPEEAGKEAPLDEEEAREDGDVYLRWFDGDIILWLML